MKKLKQIVFILFSFTSVLHGQTASSNLDEAENLIASEQFGLALPLYLNLLKNDSSNPTLNFKIGICYLNSRSQKTKAVYFLNKAIEPTSAYYSDGKNNKANGAAMPQTLLGPTQLTYDFDKVNECSEKFRKLIADVKDKELSVVEVLNLKMELKKIGEELQQFNDSPINFKIEATSKTNNASYVGYSSVYSTDKNSLVFNFEKPESKWLENNEEGMFFDDLVVHAQTASTDSSETNELADINSFLSSADTVKEDQEANVAVSDDNQVILTYRDDNGNGNLYVSSLSGNSWTKPLKLNKIINTKGWEPNECISEDGNWMYFTSDRKGGYGGLDIYRCRKMPNGEWSKATNLGPVINTIYDDRAPFILPGSTTLFFSSNGRNEVHRFDIFTSSLSPDNLWSDPVKVGYPAIAPLQEQKNATLAVKEKTSGDNFLYTFKNKNDTPIRIIKGCIIDSVGKELQRSKIKVVDNETGTVVCFSNTGNKGGYSFILPSGKNKNITYLAEGCLFQSENICPAALTKPYEKTNEIRMHPIAPGSRTVLKNVVFETNQAVLTEVSKTELENIYQLLTENPGLAIEIADYMLSGENTKANKVTSQQRAQVVEEYLLKKGIQPGRIISRGYVKYKPAKKTEKGKQDLPVATDWIELKIITKKNS